VAVETILAHAVQGPSGREQEGWEVECEKRRVESATLGTKNGVGRDDARQMGVGLAQIGVERWRGLNGGTRSFR